MESVSNTVLPVPSRKSRSSPSNRWEPKMSVLTPGSTSTSGLKESGKKIMNILENSDTSKVYTIQVGSKKAF